MNRLDFPALFSQQDRLLEITTALPDTALLVERFHGREAISELFGFDVDCVSTSANLALKALVGEEVTLQLLLADSNKRAWHGFVTQAMQLGSDGGLARYRLRIEPWCRFLSFRTNSQVLQDKDLPQILEAVFLDYPQANWQWAATQPTRKRSLCVQYRESDLDFIRRLLAEEGLAFRFAHDQTASAGDQSTHARHQLVIFDRDSSLPVGEPATVRFHRTNATEASDTVQTFSETRRVLPNAVTASSWDYKKLTATAADNISSYQNGELPILEVYDGSGAYRFEQTDMAQLRADLLLTAHESGYRRFEGSGSVRSLSHGTTFTLTQHDDYAGDNAGFLVLAVEHHGANNLGAQAAPLLTSTDVEPGTYRNRFQAQAANVPAVPLPRGKPPVTPQTALVVGLPDDPLTTERDHRVKIQFHWQRGEHPNPGGLRDSVPASNLSNAPGNERAGTWVRVAEWQAGSNWGSHTLPRIGTEVLVSFIDGDIDRPVITGQLYNGADLPPFSAGVDSGTNHPGVISGWTSHNHADGYNQWLTDDAPGQLRSRLASSHGHSQLGLGHLIHQDPRSPSRGSWRGSGFELRTDGWAAVRAGEGILISATARPNGESTQMDVAETVGQLRAAEATAKALSDAADAQGADPLQGNTEQTGFIDDIDPKQRGIHNAAVGGQPAQKARPGSRDLGDATERFDQPHILSEAPGDIGVSTPASNLVFAGRHLHATVQQDAHIASAHTVSSTVGEGASWFSHSGGIKTIAAAGEVSIQAHTDAMEVLADQSVTITSTDEAIEILAKDKIVLQAGQSSVTLQGGNVTFTCPGTFSVKGAGSAFVGPGRDVASLASLPQGTGSFINTALASSAAPAPQTPAPNPTAPPPNGSRIPTGTPANDPVFDIKTGTKLGSLLGRAATGIGLFSYSSGLGDVDDWEVDGVKFHRDGPAGALDVTYPDGSSEHYRVGPDRTVYTTSASPSIIGTLGPDNAFTPATEQDEVNYRNWLANGGEGGFAEWVSNGKPLEAAHRQMPQTSASFAEADRLYDEIRASTTDVHAIANNTGFKKENIQKVKDHVFYEEHLLDKYVDYGIPPEKSRFDSDLNQAQAWKRLERGDFTNEDIEWMKHEVAERWHEHTHGSGYSEAHDAAERRWRGNPWSDK